MAKRKEDRSLVINFADAELNQSSARLFRDYAKRHFLVGYVPDKSKNWISKNNLYNVRIAAENPKGGVRGVIPNKQKY